MPSPTPRSLVIPFLALVLSSCGWPLGDFELSGCGSSGSSSRREFDPYVPPAPEPVPVVVNDPVGHFRGTSYDAGGASLGEVEVYVWECGEEEGPLGMFEDQEGNAANFFGTVEAGDVGVPGRLAVSLDFGTARYGVVELEADVVDDRLTVTALRGGARDGSPLEDGAVIVLSRVAP